MQDSLLNESARETKTIKQNATRNDIAPPSPPRQQIHTSVEDTRRPVRQRNITNRFKDYVVIFLDTQGTKAGSERVSLMIKKKDLKALSIIL